MFGLNIKRKEKVLQAFEDAESKMKELKFLTPCNTSKTISVTEEWVIDDSKKAKHKLIHINEDSKANFILVHGVLELDYVSDKFSIDKKRIIHVLSGSIMSNNKVYNCYTKPLVIEPMEKAETQPLEEDVLLMITILNTEEKNPIFKTL